MIVAYIIHKINKKNENIRIYAVIGQYNSFIMQSRAHPVPGHYRKAQRFTLKSLEAGVPSEDEIIAWCSDRVRSATQPADCDYLELPTVDQHPSHGTTNRPSGYMPQHPFELDEAWRLGLENNKPDGGDLPVIADSEQSIADQQIIGMQFRAEPDPTLLVRIAGAIANVGLLPQLVRLDAMPEGMVEVVVRFVQPELKKLDLCRRKLMQLPQFLEFSD